LLILLVEQSSVGVYSACESYLNPLCIKRALIRFQTRRSHHKL
jgi:hypothetical protein